MFSNKVLYLGPQKRSLDLNRVLKNKMYRFCLKKGGGLKTSEAYFPPLPPSPLPRKLPNPHSIR